MQADSLVSVFFKLLVWGGALGVTYLLLHQQIRDLVNWIRRGRPDSEESDEDA